MSQRTATVLLLAIAALLATLGYVDTVAIRCDVGSIEQLFTDCGAR